MFSTMTKKHRKIAKIQKLLQFKNDGLIGNSVLFHFTVFSKNSTISCMVSVHRNKNNLIKKFCSYSDMPLYSDRSALCAWLDVFPHSFAPSRSPTWILCLLPSAQPALPQPSPRVPCSPRETTETIPVTGHPLFWTPVLPFYPHL